MAGPAVKPAGPAVPLSLLCRENGRSAHWTDGFYRRGPPGPRPYPGAYPGGPHFVRTRVGVIGGGN